MSQVTPAPPTSQPANSTTEKEMISIAEEELSRLQRQLRIMEDDRIAYQEETNIKLEKQKKIIHYLKHEKAKLYEDIQMTTSENQKKKDEKFSKEINRLLTVYDEYGEKLKKETSNLAEIDIQIKKLEKDIKNLRPKSSVSDYYYQNRLTSGQKTIEILQNRLDKMTKKFCAILTTSKNLREEINHLLKERNHFNEITEKLLKQINAGKKQIADLIEQSIAAFDQREEYCAKLDALKKRAEKDRIIYEEEMKEIQRTLDHYIKLREFLCVKGQKRILKDLEEKERLKKEKEINDRENQLQINENTLKKIQEFSNEKDMEKITTMFIKQEEENFALFNYVNELGQELEQLNTTIDEIREKIDNQIKLNEEKSEQKKSTITSLQNELESAIMETAMEEKAVEKVDNRLNEAFDCIAKIFQLVNCEKEPLLKLLGENVGINEYNVKIYLGAVERKLSTVVTELYFADKSSLITGKFKSYAELSSDRSN